MDIYEPRDETDILELVKAAVANEQALEVLGAGSKQQLGRLVEAQAALTTRGLEGVSMYEASELVMTAAPGTTMSRIIDLLDQQGQQLAFEPIDYHRFYGTEPGSATIGGSIAVNASGPRRITAGAARDALLGFRAISGRAELYKSGGRVIKNVTGYDLSKLLCGSFGTLGILSEVTFKVMPKPESEQTLVIDGLDDAAAVRLMCEAAGLPLEVSCLAHLPDCSAFNKATGDDAAMAGLAGDGGATLLRLEGPKISVRSRLQDLIEHFKSDAGSRGGDMTVVEHASSAALWRGVGDGAPLAGLDDFAEALIWRVSTAPSHGAQAVAAIFEAAVPLIGHYYDWAGGLIWLAVDGLMPAPFNDAHGGAIRRAVDRLGGHATLIRAAPEQRSATPVFHPQPAALAALNARVKDSFDPKHILNPGRLVAKP